MSGCMVVNIARTMDLWNIVDSVVKHPHLTPNGKEMGA